MEMRGKGKKKSKDIEMLGVSYRLPVDIIIFNILVRLPVLDVIRCTSVCKEWYFLIKSPHFISTHLSFPSSSSRSQPSVFIHHYSFSEERQVLSLQHDPQSFNYYTTVPFPFPLYESLDAVGPIHGLFCLCHCGDSGLGLDELYCLWNPSLRRYIRLPSPPPTSSLNLDQRPTIKRGFGFDDKSKDYKVMLLAYLTEEEDRFSQHFNCQVFSLKQGSWRTVDVAVEAKYCIITSYYGCFVNGALHWLAVKPINEHDFHHFVLAFDIALETFKKMELPKELLHKSHNYYMLEIKGWLACYNYGNDQAIPEPQGINCYDIWVMKEDGMKDLWVKMWTFRLMDTLSFVYGFWGSGDDILIERGDDEEQLLYDTKTHGIRAFGGGVKPFMYSIFTYNESLVLLDKESEAVSYEDHTPVANRVSVGMTD